MPARTTTSWQAQAYRFELRRLDAAISTGEVFAHADRRRRATASILSVASGIVLAAALVVGRWSDHTTGIGDAAVVIDSDDGAVFVHHDGRLDPALNYTSALLVAGRESGGSQQPPTVHVGTAAIAGQPRGAGFGIPGAPSELPDRDHLFAPVWTVCSSAQSAGFDRDPAAAVTTTALLGVGPARSAQAPSSGVLVSADAGATVFLLRAGSRNRLDVSDPAVRQVFGLDTAAAVHAVGAALLAVVPEAAPIAVPTIVGVGDRTTWSQPLGLVVGDVAAVRDTTGRDTLVVALADGVQAVPSLVADLIRARYARTGALPLLAPGAMSAAPHTQHPLDVGAYPAQPPDTSGAAMPVLCVVRQALPRHGRTVLLQALPLPAGAQPVPVGTPRAGGADSVLVAPGSGAVLSVVRSVEGKGSPVRERLLVTDQGIAFVVNGSHALGWLGLAGTAAPTSEDLVALLPRGPTLDAAAAMHGSSAAVRSPAPRGP